MQLFMMVLNRTEHLNHLLSEFEHAGFHGATAIDSRGMARILHSEEEMPLFYGLRSVVNPERRNSKTLFAVLTDEQVARARDIVNAVTGGFDEPDSGIMFAVPVTFVEGLDKKK